MASTYAYASGSSAIIVGIKFTDSSVRHNWELVVSGNSYYDSQSGSAATNDVHWTFSGLSAGTYTCTGYVDGTSVGSVTVTLNSGGGGGVDPPNPPTPSTKYNEPLRATSVTINASSYDSNNQSIVLNLSTTVENDNDVTVTGRVVYSISVNGGDSYTRNNFNDNTGISIYGTTIPLTLGNYWIGSLPSTGITIRVTATPWHYEDGYDSGVDMIEGYSYTASEHFSVHDLGATFYWRSQSDRPYQGANISDYITATKWNELCRLLELNDLANKRTGDEILASDVIRVLNKVGKSTSGVSKGSIITADIFKRIEDGYNGD